MTALWIVAVVAAFGLGWIVGGRRRTENPWEPHVVSLAKEIERGRVEPSAGPVPEPVARLRSGLEAGWAPRNVEREEALKQALGRIAGFLQESVEAPLARVRDGDQALLREGVDRALGGLQDLEFFLREPLTPDETHDLTPVVQQAVRDFIADWEVGVRLAAPSFPVRVHIHRETFQDALYLLLHNAGHFSEWKTVDVRVEEEDGHARVVIRDQGPGFSSEALERARDLFYTTKPAGLGLGIPLARKIIEGFGGQLEIQNRGEGGAEVALVLPGA